MAERRASILVVDETGGAMTSAAKSLTEKLEANEQKLHDDSAEQLVLAIGGDGMELREAGMKPGHGMKIDPASLDLRTGSGGLSRKQPIVKAFGPKVHTIVDATTGTGQDAVLLAALGYHVTAVERSIVLHAMLEDALAKAFQTKAFSDAVDRRLCVRLGDSRKVLPTIDPPPDAVYIDPMFPPKRRASALPRKEIQIVRKLVGDDSDAEGLLTIAMEAAQQRVIVKRPHHAPPLGAEPSLCFEGKLVRYDVYLVRNA